MPPESLQTSFSSNLSVGRVHFWGVAACIVVSVVGCGGVTEPVGSTKGAIANSGVRSDESTPDSEELSDDGDDWQGAALEDACALEEGGTFRANSMGSFLETVTGVWVLCTRTSVFSQEPTEKGIEITDEGTWYHLYGDSPSTLERGLGFGKEGSYDILDTSSFNGPGVYQLNLNISGSGGIITMPQFTESGSFMALNNNGVHYGQYRKL